jgi:hypothetical protein
VLASQVLGNCAIFFRAAEQEHAFTPFATNATVEAHKIARRERKIAGKTKIFQKRSLKSGVVERQQLLFGSRIKRTSRAA